MVFLHRDKITLIESLNEDEIRGESLICQCLIALTDVV